MDLTLLMAWRVKQGYLQSQMLCVRRVAFFKNQADTAANEPWPATASKAPK